MQSGPAQRQRTRAEEAAAAHKQALVAVGEFIRAQRQLGQLSLRELAERARVSNPYLSQLERGLYQPSAPVLRSIARALGVNTGTMFTMAGFLDEEGKETRKLSVEQAISVDPRLSPEQKRALKTIYRSFLAETP